MAKKARKTRRKTTRRRKKSRRSCFPWLKLTLAFVLVLVAYMAFLDFQVYRQFEGKRWTLPARVYARPLELYAGLRLSAEQMATELKALGYRFTSSARKPGEVSRNNRTFHIKTRPFHFWDGAEPSHNLRLQFQYQQLAALTDAASREAVAIARLDPLEIGSIHTARQEDRILLKLDEVPETLIKTLITVEDRTFYKHFGVSLKAIARAFLANMRAGEVVQGGSTLTQQLVKNFFLTSKQSIWRKLNEALMSISLELRYDKDEILEAYLNEIYLAQDGQRAIHGFGLGSQFLFQRPVNELSTGQIAMLVGMVKGPSYYDPRRHPKRARSRRDLVLRIMREAGIITSQQEQSARQEKVELHKVSKGTSSTFPGFLDLVRRQLRRDYYESDLTDEGLKIFTTLDPQVQWALQRSLSERLATLEKTRPSLQGAGVITNASNAEVLALAGGREAGFAGFNRVLDAKRPIGSLIKPAIYLTALEQPQRYSLATLVSDEPLQVEQRGSPVWEPQNYDKSFHGEIMLYQALANSYNVATARLGMELGLGEVIQTLRRVGVSTPLNAFPSLLLGAADMSPLEVTGFYQTFASGGYLMPLRSIRAVLDADNDPLQRYDLKVNRVVKPAPALLITRALQGVIAQGTGRALNHRFSSEFGLAGKTGTTNDLRDSWFAGFDGERLGVIWVGRDDNQPMGLTGASGALQVWSDVFQGIGTSPVLMAQPENIDWRLVDMHSGGLASKQCTDTVQLPFIAQGVLPEPAPCEQTTSPRRWFEDLFNE